MVKASNSVRDLMQKLVCGAVVAMCAVCFASAASRAPVRLEAEEGATLHVGQTAVVQLSASHRVSGGAGTTLVLVRQTRQRDRTVYVYRAVRTGNQVILVTPRDIPDGHCISCATEHYFITVVR